MSDSPKKITQIQRLTIVGVGLIGGSLARALKKNGISAEIVGFGRSEDHLKRALTLGVIDRYELDIARAVKDADVVLLAVPIGAIEGLLSQLSGKLAPGVVVSDVGSVKGSVVDAVARVFGAADKVAGDMPANFVPAHPIAGAEESGVDASRDDLYVDHSVILTPTPETDPAAVACIQSMWEKAGATVSTMEVGHHDQVLAATSHLPHLLAYTLVDSLMRLDEGEEIFRYSAGGFRDFTRIASSDPRMWHDICLSNSQAILNMLEHFTHDLKALAGIIRRGDSESLMAVFTRAKQARDRHCLNDQRSGSD